ncbi:hypothetical protein CLV59_10175 [Chitinophaga dinghuensis]|uniref:Uncharacterized protein n=1 Tax=Chitinophaga dinghuensis TaxID=1539050 RepID=A0A327WCW4_9BACT|nr:hypothetical protein CLV59_10175 [Chitinophaga dinghuensis]
MNYIYQQIAIILCCFAAYAALREKKLALQKLQIIFCKVCKIAYFSLYYVINQIICHLTQIPQEPTDVVE